MIKKISKTSSVSTGSNTDVFADVSFSSKLEDLMMGCSFSTWCGDDDLDQRAVKSVERIQAGLQRQLRPDELRCYLRIAEVTTLYADKVFDGIARLHTSLGRALETAELDAIDDLFRKARAHDLEAMGRDLREKGMHTFPLGELSREESLLARIEVAQKACGSSFNAEVIKRS